MARRVRIGLIGTGWMGKVEFDEFRVAVLAFRQKHAEPVLEIVASTRRDRAEQVAREWGYSPIYGQLARGPRRWPVSASWRDICTPDNSHFEIGMAGVEAGKHVYCEWGWRDPRSNMRS